MKTYMQNIKINYVYSFFMNLNLTQGIWMIYLVSRGLSLFEVGLLEGIFHVTSFLMETPTGVVADLFGRKTSRLVGLVFSVIGALLMIYSRHFLGYSLSFIVSALSYNFESGAGEALIYDSLKVSKKEQLFMKVTGKNELIFNFTSIIALLFGGIIGSVDHLWVFKVGILITMITFIIGLLFKEPHMDEDELKDEKKQDKEKKSYNILNAIKGQYLDSFQVIKSQKKLSYLIIFSALIGMFVTLSFFYLQVLWKASGYIEWQIGIILAVSAFVAMGGALLAEKVDQKFGEIVLLKYSPFIITIGLLMFYNVSTSIVSFALLSFFDSMLFVALRDYLNKIIPSKKRATILSFESMMFSFFMILLFPAFGYVSEMIGMKNSFLILGGILLLLSIYNLRVLGGKFYKAG